MAQRYRKDGLTKRGDIWYLQFRILDWMRKLPAFRNIPPSKTIFNQSLRTSNYLEAAKLADAIRIKMQLKDAPKPKPLSVGQEAYLEAVLWAQSLSDEELELTHDAYTSLQHEAIQEVGEFGKGGARINDKNLFSNSTESIAAIEREWRRRIRGKNFDEPLAHPITLKYAVTKYIEEMVSLGRAKKTQSKVKNAAQRFLEWREVSDIELRLIRPATVKQYITQARLEKRNKNTFSNDIHYLGRVFNLALEEDLISNIENPFKGREIVGFEEEEKRRIFSNEMLVRMKNDQTTKEDHDLRQLFWISYFTGMRLSEVFTAKYRTVDDVLCFDVASDGGKTKDATRIIPVHSWLRKNLIKDVKDGDPLRWKSSTDTALGKRFGRFKNKVLCDLLPSGREHLYVHHSFRHGASTVLMNETRGNVGVVAKFMGHKMANVGRTETERTYFGQVPVKDLKRLAELIPLIE